MTHNEFLKKFVTTAIEKKLPLDGSVLEEVNLVELYLYGVVAGHGIKKPLMILKDKEKRHSLPIHLNSLEAGISLVNLDPVQKELSPQQIAIKILLDFGYQHTKTIFTEILNQQLMVEMVFAAVSERAEVKEKRMRIPASQAVAMTILTSAKFFASESTLEMSKTLVFDQDAEAEMQLFHDPRMRPHRYLM